MSYAKRWTLWYKRPKVHMMCHVVSRGCTVSFEVSNQLRRDCEEQLLAGAPFVLNPASLGLSAGSKLV